MIHTLQQSFPGVSFGLDVQIIGLRNTRIGPGSCIGDHAWLNVCTRDEHVRLIVGKRVLVGRGSMLSAGGHLEIGDYCLFAPQVYVSDADHVFANIAKPYMDQGATAGKVVVEENCWLGINAVVIGNIVVGRGSIVAANAVVTRDVPPFSVVAGVPAKAIKMFNPAMNVWQSVNTPDDLQHIKISRNSHGLPTREEYRFILSKTASTNNVDPIVAGNGVCI